jgi:hypothetical protein
MMMFCWRDSKRKHGNKTLTAPSRDVAPLKEYNERSRNMAGKYFGTKGDAVLQMQKQLNALGAGLKEDGIWGKKTEAAYNRLSGRIPATQDAQNGSNGAQAVVPNEFDEDLQFEKDKARRLTDAVQTSISRLDPEYKARLDALEKAYVGKKGMCKTTYCPKGWREAVTIQTFRTMNTSSGTATKQLHWKKKSVSWTI